MSEKALMYEASFNIQQHLVFEDTFKWTIRPNSFYKIFFPARAQSQMLSLRSVSST